MEKAVKIILEKDFYKNQLKKAKEILNWENESLKLISFYKKIDTA